MNIRQLIDWRKQCYFCQGELDIFPILGLSEAKFSLKEKSFNIKTSQYTAQIDLESGQISISKYLSPSVFLKSATLTIEMKCVRCCENRKYSYKGELRNPGDGYVQVLEFYERVVIDGITISQAHFGRSYDGMLMRVKGKIVTLNPLPLIDLNKTPPDKLKNKLKTYLTFS